MTIDELPRDLRRRIMSLSLTPDGHVIGVSLRHPKLAAGADEARPEPVMHKDDDPMCPCPSCSVLFQAADQ